MGLTLDISSLEDWTTPLFAGSRDDPAKVKIRDEMMHLYMDTAIHYVHGPMNDRGVKSLVKYHVSVLGRQDACKVLGVRGQRFSIWQLWPDAVLMVNNKKGVCLEVTREVTFDRSCELMRDYARIMKNGRRDT
jgi:hypothetical protein